MDGLGEIAEDVAEKRGVSVDALFSRWDGNPGAIIEDIFRVRDPESRQVRDITLFPYQHTMANAYYFGDSSTIVVYKGRRIGCTYIYEMCMALDAQRIPNTVFPIVAQTGDDAVKRIRDIKEIFLNSRLPYDTEADFEKCIEKKIVLPNGSRFESFTAGSDSGRGDEPARSVLLDEMAFFEDQADTLAAFSASTSLGMKSKQLQVSTPRTLNDKFMQSYRNGTPTGYADSDGNAVSKDHPDARPVTISIQQPSFHLADEIDPEISLYDQDARPVRPDMNLQAVEEERARDPNKFAQEYLCRPISDEYRFFTREGTERAIKRSEAPDYRSGWGTMAQDDGTMVMGIDLAFGGHDDSVITVFEHLPNRVRKMRYFEVVSRRELSSVPGIDKPEPGNDDHVARMAAWVAESMGVEHIVYDATGGKPFYHRLRNYTGRGLHPFNFSDQGAVLEMAESLNHGLHNDLVTLVDNNRDTLRDQLLAVVKKQTEDYNRPKFSGKEQAPEGKDDAAMATILGAYPVMLSDTGSDLWYYDKDDSPSRSGEGENASFDTAKTIHHVNPESEVDRIKREMGIVSPKRRQRPSERRNKRRF